MAILPVFLRLGDAYSF